MCLCILDYPSVQFPKYPPMLRKFTLLSPLNPPSYSVPMLLHAKSADFIFLPPVVRKCPFQGSRFLPPDCLNPTSVWIVFLFQTKYRGGITTSLPFTLFFDWQQLGSLKHFFLSAFAFFSSFFFGVSCLEKHGNLLNLKLSISCKWGLFLQVFRADFLPF